MLRKSKALGDYCKTSLLAKGSGGRDGCKQRETIDPNCKVFKHMGNSVLTLPHLRSSARSPSSPGRHQSLRPAIRGCCRRSTEPSRPRRLSLASCLQDPTRAQAILDRLANPANELSLKAAMAPSATKKSRQNPYATRVALQLVRLPRNRRWRVTKSATSRSARSKPHPGTDQGLNEGPNHLSRRSLTDSLLKDANPNVHMQLRSVNFSYLCATDPARGEFSRDPSSVSDELQNAQRGNTGIIQDRVCCCRYTSRPRSKVKNTLCQNVRANTTPSCPFNSVVDTPVAIF